MKITFQNHAQAILWIAKQAESEDHFKVLRQDLQLNHLFTETYFIHNMLVSN